LINDGYSISSFAYTLLHKYSIIPKANQTLSSLVREKKELKIQVKPFTNLFFQEKFFSAHKHSFFVDTHRSYNNNNATISSDTDILFHSNDKDKSLNNMSSLTHIYHHT
jgi:hypothetical protein